MKLRIDGTEYPLPEQAFALDYDARALRDIESNRSGVHARLSLPSTPQTDALFGNAFDPLTAKRFNSQIHKGEIEVDGIVLFRGVVRFLSAVSTGRDTRYRIEIIGGAVQWAKKTALTRLERTELPFITTFTPTDICHGWTDDQPVKFLPVHRDAYRLTNSSVSLLPAEKILMVDDYHPFISVAELINAIFAQAGYTVESEFLQTPFFRSLYMSGAYASSDVSARKRTMDFKAGRLADATAISDAFGRVYVSPSVSAHNLGNIVDCTDAYVTDAAGANKATGFFSANDCFSVTDGIAQFAPLTSVSVGFEYSIAFVTDYEIVSRTELSGFNKIYLGDGVTVPFTIANRFEDHRLNPQPGYAYNWTLVDSVFRLGTYRLEVMNGDKVVATFDSTSRQTRVVMPNTPITGIVMKFAASNKPNDFKNSTVDWALYETHVGTSGQTEVEITVRTPPQELSAAAVKRFNDIFFDCGKQGKTFTLLRRTTVRPVFTSRPGHGSTVAFADIAHLGITQITLLEALQHMFNLRFCTDEQARTVRIDSHDIFFGSNIVDWSDRIDALSTVEIADPSLDMHETCTLAYQPAEGAVARYNSQHDTELGRWSFKADSKATLEGNRSALNPLFTPTLNARRVYAAAESALIMEVCDRDDDDIDDNTLFTPRIVCYEGLHPLPDGELWGYPFSLPLYPFAAFHFTGDEYTVPFTLCFEDRDGLQGLHRYYDRQFAEDSQGLRVTLWMHLHPDDVAGIFCGHDNAHVSARSLFRLRIAGQQALYTLESIQGYDPAKTLTKCTFRKTIKTQ